MSGQERAPDGIPFALSSYRSASLPISAQQLINCYTETQREGMDAKTPAALIGSPGLADFAAVGAGPIRAATEMDGEFYCVSGTQFFHVDSAGAETLLGGGIAAGENVIGIANSGTEIIVVDGTNGFSYVPAGAGYQQIIDGDFKAASHVTYLNGFFLFPRDGTNEFFSSDVNNGMAYDALFFSNAETNPDNVQAVLSYQQQAYVTGKKGIEVWQFNPNTSGFPWIRLPGVNIAIGVAGPLAAYVHVNKLYFVGDDSLLYRIAGGQPEPLSDPAVASAWKSYGDISDVVVWGVSHGLQEWIVITFPTARRTWIFDGWTGFFHERVSHDAAMVSYERWRGNVHAKCYGRHLIGDRFSNKVGILSDTTFNEFGDPLMFRAVAPAMHRKGAKVFMSSLEALMEAGVGLTTGQGSDPQIILDWSDDHGASFRPFQMSRSFGRIGERQRRVRFTELGSFDQRNYRFTITDPVKRVLVSVVPKADGGLQYS